jgi:hypothetical protein
MSEHFWGSNKGFEILTNTVQNPLVLVVGVIVNLRMVTTIVTDTTQSISAGPVRP